MNNEKFDEALRLADALTDRNRFPTDRATCDESAAELRRLYWENQAHRTAQAKIYQALGSSNPNRDEWPTEISSLRQEHEEDQGVIAVWRGRTQRAEAQRDQLLEALRWIARVNAMDYEYVAVARTAIAAAEGEKK